MLKVKFILRNKDASKEVPIHVRITDGRKVDAWGRTKESTLIENWDIEKSILKEKYFKTVKGKNVEKRDANTKEQISRNKEVNKRLFELKNQIEDAYKSNKTEIVNTKWLKNIINPAIENNRITNKIPNDLVEYIDFYIRQRGINIGKEHKTKLKSIQKILKGFKSANSISDLLIEDINNQFKIEFEKYCQAEKYSPNYTARNIRFIKTICNHASNNGLKTHHQLKNIKTKVEKVEITYLSFEELEQIEKTKQPYDYLENAKDWLIISCYTGQRVSDFMSFTKDKIRIEKEKHLIEFTQQKTKKMIALPLHKKVLKILKKRNGEFPRKISSQKYNEYIKIVCKNAKLDSLIKGSKAIGNRKIKGIYPKYELITSHIGRRSFASNHFGTIPTPLLMVATGHTTERMFLNYIGKTNTQQSLALAEYF